MTEHNKNQFSFLWNIFKKQSNLKEAPNPNIENTLQNFYYTFIEHHPDTILIIDLDGKVVSYNKQRLNKQLGYRANKQLDYKTIVSEEDYASLKSAFKTATQGTPEQIEFQLLHKQGHKLEMHATFIPLETPSKAIEGISLTVKDITQQKQLAKSHELKAIHLEQAQQIANIGSWEYVIEKDEIKWSKTCTDIFGFDNTEHVPKDIPLALIHPEDYEQLDQLLHKAISEGIAYMREYRIYHGKTESLRYLKVNVEIEMKNNQPYKLIGIVQDVTDQTMLTRHVMETNKSYRHIFDHLQAGIWMRESID